MYNNPQMVTIKINGYSHLGISKLNNVILNFQSRYSHKMKQKQAGDADFLFYLSNFHIMQHVKGQFLNPKTNFNKWIEISISRKPHKGKTTTQKINKSNT